MGKGRKGARFCAPVLLESTVRALTEGAGISGGGGGMCWAAGWLPKLSRTWATAWWLDLFCSSWIQRFSGCWGSSLMMGGDAWSLRHFFQCLTGVWLSLDRSLMTKDNGSCGLDSLELRVRGDIWVSSESEIFKKDSSFISVRATCPNKLWHIYHLMSIRFLLVFSQWVKCWKTVQKFYWILPKQSVVNDQVTRHLSLFSDIYAFWYFAHIPNYLVLKHLLLSKRTKLDLNWSKIRLLKLKS